MAADAFLAADTPAACGHWSHVREGRQRAIFQGWAVVVAVSALGGLVRPGWFWLTVGFAGLRALVAAAFWARVLSWRSSARRTGRPRVLAAVPRGGVMRDDLRDRRCLDLLVWDYLRLPGPAFRSTA